MIDDVRIAKEQELCGKGMGGYLLKVASASRGERATFQDLAIDAALVFENYVAEFVSGGEALDVQRTASRPSSARAAR